LLGEHETVTHLAGIVISGWKDVLEIGYRNDLNSSRNTALSNL